MGITKAACCCMSPLYLSTHRRIRVDKLATCTWGGRRNCNTVQHQHKVLQKLKCWKIHCQIHWTRSREAVVFCLPTSSSSSEDYHYYYESESSLHEESDGESIGIEGETNTCTAQGSQYRAQEISESQNSEAAAGLRQVRDDDSFYDICLGELDMDSSNFSMGLINKGLPSMDGRSKRILLLEGHINNSGVKSKKLQKRVNEPSKLMKMERFSDIRESGSGCCFINSQDLSGSTNRKGCWFPYMDKFKSGDVIVSSSEVLQSLDPYIAETRKKKIREVVMNRTYSICLVVEGLTDLGNISAVFRTADALGFQSVHVITNDSTKRYKQSRNVSMGSEKWLDIEQWDSTRECFEVLRSRGYRIAVTHVGNDTVSVHDMDWTLPTAIVLGNEHRGITGEALEFSDIKCSIPMTGMVDSFNVSVAAGIFMHTAVHDRISCMGSHGDLRPKERQILAAEFYLRHKKNVINIMDRIVDNGMPRHICL